MSYESKSQPLLRHSAQGAIPQNHYRGRSAASAAPDNPLSTRSIDPADRPNIGRERICPSNGQGERPSSSLMESFASYALPNSQHVDHRWGIQELRSACDLVIKDRGVRDELLKVIALISDTQDSRAAETDKTAVDDGLNGRAKRAAAGKQATTTCPALFPSPSSRDVSSKCVESAPRSLRAVSSPVGAVVSDSAVQKHPLKDRGDGLGKVAQNAKRSVKEVTGTSRKPRGESSICPTPFPSSPASTTRFAAPLVAANPPCTLVPAHPHHPLFRCSWAHLADIYTKCLVHRARSCVTDGSICAYKNRRLLHAIAVAAALLVQLES
ncbi:hypothetical protein MVEN_01950900 [Mycena venus]|uniref:Uncharacterized protein n=1 Tax=Mycena venus TaxID=2733690 RepID=A0A8H7CM23_9AGAR|nr:hypothetical protein MVEN_01950900 [Mycena venus]